MGRIREGWRRLRALTRFDSLERGLDEEIRFHLEHQVAKHVRAGLPPHEARRQAFLQFGGVERVKEDTRDEFRPALLQDAGRDLRYSLRALRRAPTFTLVATLTLALGIGATTAVFTVVNGVLIKPLPYPEPERLVSLEHAALGMNAGSNVKMSAALLATYLAENRTFEHMGVHAAGTGSVTGAAEPEEVQALWVSLGTLRALAVEPGLGRGFAPGDHEPGGVETALLSHGYWERRHGRRPDIVGATVTVDGRPRTIIGVLPAGFRFLEHHPDVVLPFRFETTDLTLGRFNYDGLARLRPGVTIEQANADIARMLPRWLEAWPSFPGIPRDVFEKARLAPALQPLKQSVVGDVGKTLGVLMGTIGIVLLIACANVANLLLVRAEARQHERAVRAALGAGKGRLAREMLIESLVLGGLGGTLGLVLAAAGLQLLVAVAPETLPRLQEITLDPMVIGFTLLISVLSALVFGCLPLVRHAGWQLAHPLRGSSRSATDSRERQRVRSSLVVVQVALALVLLVGSGLMMRTFVALRSIPPGFVDPHRVQLARVHIPPIQVPDPDRVFRMQMDIRDRIAAIPGVSAVSFSAAPPMTGAPGRSTILVENLPDGGTDQATNIRWLRFVAPGFFDTVGTRFIAGRDFTASELYAHRPVAIVSENLARELWREPGAAIGKRIRATNTGPWREIVGVVGDVYDRGVHLPAPTIVYWPSLMKDYYENPVNVMRASTFAVRSSRSGSEGLLAEIRDAIWAVNPSLPLTRVQTLGEVYDRSMASTSFALVMLAIAAAMALLLGVVGIYGVIAYSVSQRTREIGIRVALGARRSELKAMFVRHGVMLALAGVACGLGGAALLTRLMTSLLFGTSPLDPVTYGLVSVGLVAVAALASYVPANGAMSVDPVRTLRGD